MDREGFRACEEAFDAVWPSWSAPDRSPMGDAAELWSADTFVSVACLRPLTTEDVLEARLWPRGCGFVATGWRCVGIGLPESE